MDIQKRIDAAIAQSIQYSRIVRTLPNSETEREQAITYLNTICDGWGDAGEAQEYWGRKDCHPWAIILMAC